MQDIEKRGGYILIEVHTHACIHAVVTSAVYVPLLGWRGPETVAAAGTEYEEVQKCCYWS